MLNGQVDALPAVAEINAEIEAAGIVSASGSVMISTELSLSSSVDISTSVVTASQTDALVISGSVSTMDIAAFEASIEAAVMEGDCLIYSSTYVYLRQITSTLPYETQY